MSENRHTVAIDPNDLVVWQQRTLLERETPDLDGGGVFEIKKAELVPGEACSFSLEPLDEVAA